MAMTATGSVAAISAPNANADAVGQPRNCIIPAATTAAETTTPSVESTRIGSHVPAQFVPVDAQRRFEQQRRQDHVEDEIVGEFGARLDIRRGEADAGGDQTHRIRKPQPPRHDRHHYGDAEQADGAGENDVHAAE